MTRRGGPGPLRVAIDVRELQQALRNSPDGGLGGPGRYAFGLVGALLRRDGVSWRLLVDRGPVPERLMELARVRPDARLVPTGLPAAVALRRYGRLGWRIRQVEAPLLDLTLRTIGVDVLHGLEAPPCCRFAPVVSTLYDLGGPTEGAAVPAAFASYRRHASVVCISRSSAVLAVDRLGLDPGRVIQSHTGLDDAFLAACAGETRRSTSSPAYFLHVGVLRRRKNPEGLLRGFAALARDSEVHLLCVGPYQTDPGAAAAVHDLAVELGISGRVGLLGDCDDRQLRELYRGAMALVFPSFWEGFGLPVAEALALGTPCVASDRGGLVEAGGDLPIYVDPRDHAAIAAAMRRVMLDGELQARVRREGPLWARQFDWAHAAGRVLDACAAAAGRPPGHGPGVA